ncbi:uncharacterized protein VP01_10275g1 [Puccinia sorghi]|uniref:Uncharacterized protein n=1 Tax=Puccinia sorghi TaxID=27349 RepID=A0A0L6VW20_9BASI|nr:uncharacterized protein VP01_10275g1 [Puccinia sorghi]
MDLLRKQEFACFYPEQAHPREIGYVDLMRLESDNALWNDGLFSKKNQPWAVDVNTQHCIWVGDMQNNEVGYPSALNTQASHQFILVDAQHIPQQLYSTFY